MKRRTFLKLTALTPFVGLIQPIPKQRLLDASSIAGGEYSKGLQTTIDNALLNELGVQKKWLRTKYKGEYF